MVGLILAADIGGTNCRAAIIRISSRKFSPGKSSSSNSYSVVLRKQAPTSDLNSFLSLLSETKKEGEQKTRQRINVACLSIAGPLSANRAHVDMTNAKLSIDAAWLKKKLGLKSVLLLNDFEAVGHGIALLKNKDVMRISTGAGKVVAKNQAKAALGAGTGLGVSVMVYCPGKKIYMPLPSEAGHMLFTAKSDSELRLCHYSRRHNLSHARSGSDGELLWPDYETFVSGPGLSLLHEFILSDDISLQSRLSLRLRSLDVASRNDAIERNYDKDVACRKALEMFYTFYARACQQVALASCCYSGMYLCGGVTMHSLNFLKKNRRVFMDEFLRHAHYSEFLKRIPVFVILDEDLWVKGCVDATNNASIVTF